MRLALAVLLTAVGAFAQAPVQPGQLASTVLPRAEARPVIAVIQESKDEHHDRLMRRVWIASAFAVLGATGADAATSWGKHEANGFLASSNGTFGARGLTIKAGLAAGLLAPQFLLHRDSHWRRRFTIGNLIEAGVFAGVAVHNTGVTTQGN